MADISSTSTDEAAEAVDTSVTSEDTTDESEDVALEDIEVDVADIEDEPDEEQETETEVEESTDDEPSEEEAEESTEDEAEPELSDEQKQAEHNRLMFERRQQEKQARIDKVRQDQAQYVAEASEVGDPIEIAVRQLQVDGYNNTVEALSNKLTNGYERAITDFPVLKTDDPVIQAEIDATIDAFQAMNVTIDAYGNPTEVRGDLYAALQAKADSIEKLTGIRAKRQEQSKGKEKSKTLATPTRAPKQPKVDPDLAAFDEEAEW